MTFAEQTHSPTPHISVGWLLNMITNFQCYKQINMKIYLSSIYLKLYRQHNGSTLDVWTLFNRSTVASYETICIHHKLSEYTTPHIFWEVRDIRLFQAKLSSLPRQRWSPLRCRIITFPPKAGFARRHEGSRCAGRCIELRWHGSLISQRL